MFVAVGVSRAVGQFARRPLPSVATHALVLLRVAPSVGVALPLPHPGAAGGLAVRPVTAGVEGGARAAVAGPVGARAVRAARVLAVQAVRARVIAHTHVAVGRRLGAVAARAARRPHPPHGAPAAPRHRVRPVTRAASVAVVGAPRGLAARSRPPLRADALADDRVRRLEALAVRATVDGEPRAATQRAELSPPARESAVARPVRRTVTEPAAQRLAVEPVEARVAHAAAVDDRAVLTRELARDAEISVGAEAARQGRVGHADAARVTVVDAQRAAAIGAAPAGVAEAPAADAAVTVPRAAGRVAGAAL